jgi:hypothetical protein
MLTRLRKFSLSDNIFVDESKFEQTRQNTGGRGVGKDDEAVSAPLEDDSNTE